MWTPRSGITRHEEPLTDSTGMAGASASFDVESFEGDAATWDRSLDGLDGSSFCHRFGWKSVMEDALGHETFWQVARGPDGAIEGLLPLVRVRSRLFGDYLVSMPFLNYGGPVGADAARHALCREATTLAARLRVDLLELRNRSHLPTSELALNQRKLTVVKALPSTAEELWEKGIKAKVRSQIRRPQKEGMEISFGGEHLDAFYDVFSRTMRDLGTPALPKVFFEKIREAFPDTTVFALVELRGEPMAAACGLTWQDEFEITWAGASREHARLAPNMLLYWGLMEDCVRLGLGRFNFGRCSPDSGTHRFKRQWGSEDEPLPWLQWSPSGIVSTPDPNSRKFRLASSAWSRLPLPVTNLIGPRLSRVIP